MIKGSDSAKWHTNIPGFQEIVYPELCARSVIIVRDGEIVYINNTGIKLFGVSIKEELIGKSVLNFLHPEYFEIVQNHIKYICNGNTAEFMEQQFNRMDGELLEAEVKGSPTIFKNEPVVHLMPEI
jgi:PAS domain S-box-containing protein